MKKTIPLFLLCAVLFTACASSQYGVETPDPQIFVCEETYGELFYAGALRKTDGALAEALDAALASMIEDGTAGLICEKWLRQDLIAYDTSAQYEVQPGDESLKAVREAGTLKVGYMTDCYPMSFSDANDSVQGCDVDLIFEAARRMGLSVTFEKVGWENQVAKLNNGDIDVIFSGLGITEAVEKELLLTRGYLKTTFSLLVGSQNEGKNLSELSGKTLGAPDSSAAFDFLAEYGVPEENLMAFTSASYGYYRLKERRVDALLVDTPFADWVARGKMQER